MDTIILGIAVANFLLVWILINTFRIIARMDENNVVRKQQKVEHAESERFIIDEEHDMVIDNKTNTRMTVFEYNSLMLASTEEDETEDIE